AILLPALGLAKETARRGLCLSNLRGIGRGMAIYAEDYQGKFPNGNSSQRWLDYDDTNAMLVVFANHYIETPASFHCPSDKDPVPTVIESGAHNAVNSARVSYDYFAAYFPPEQGPIAQNIGYAPIAWDLDGGSATETPVQNHGTTGGNVVFGDN